jgi:hypothetical protein
MEHAALDPRDASYELCVVGDWAYAGKAQMIARTRWLPS